MGATPNQGRPDIDGFFDIRDVKDAGGWSSGLIKAFAKATPLASFINVEDQVNGQIKQPIQQIQGEFETLEEEMIQSGAVVSDHENRITRLESGNIVAEYFSNDVWTKPLLEGDPYHHHVLIGLAGGGGGRRSANSNGAPRGGSEGGGQGGYADDSFLDAEVDGTINVVIGTGGEGGDSNGENGTAGTPTTFTDTTHGTLLTAGGGPGGTTLAPNPGSGTHPEWAANGGKGCTIVSNTDVVPGSSGGNGYLALGGQGADSAGENGANGGACPAGRIGPGGGGGGGYHNDPSFNGGCGGHGGFPSGAGGATGPNGSTGFFVGPSPDFGGDGADGRALIVSYIGA
jgi:hypothetical protein